MSQERGSGFGSVPPAFSTEPGTQWAPPKSMSVPTGLLPPPLPAPAPLDPKSLQTPAQVRLSLPWAPQLGNQSPGLSTSEGNSRQRARRGGNSLNQLEELILTIPEALRAPGYLFCGCLAAQQTYFLTKKKGRRGVKVASCAPCLLAGSGRSVPAAPTPQGCQAQGSTAHRPRPALQEWEPQVAPFHSAASEDHARSHNPTAGAPGAARAQTGADPASSRLTYLST